MRHHYIEITAERWKDRELVQRIKSEARGIAGRNPGMRVVVKREITTVSPPGTQYQSVRRGKGNCRHCHKPFKRHEQKPPYQCPNLSYWEQVWEFCNHSREVQEWR